ncbi:chaplin, partial [Streptomyces sp. YS-3]|uniref:chaplin n=1 Tax=Streptomyces sp. YS-3 TaxID=3381352 RepID=UPI0038622EE9
MRQVIKKTLFTAMAASSVLSMSGACAHAADAHSETGDSPGVLSGNSIQAPLDVPVNACGNTVDPVGALNPAFGNTCSHGPDEEDAYEQAYERVYQRYQDDGGDGSYRGGHGGSYGDDRYEHDRGYGHDRDYDRGPESGYGDEYGYGHGHGYGYGDDYRRDDHRHAAPTGTHAETHGSPGVLSGNAIQAPVKAPVNLCGNTVNVIALLNPAFGSNCANKESAGPRHARPP